MAESTNKQNGDGSDNYEQAAKETANAVKQAGKEAVKQAAAKGAEATAKAMGAMVKTGLKTGKAVSQIAAGTAAGGPFGAIISAAWSMRHTLFKVLVSIGLVIVFIVVIIVSLPSIMFEKLKDDFLGLFGGSSEGSALNAAYTDLFDNVYDTIEDGYRFALEEVARIIKDGGYDYELSISSLDDQAAGTENYDVCYILSAYSASVQQKNSSEKQMINKLESVKADMFPVTYEEKSLERPKDKDSTETETVKCVVCVIHPFEENIILTAFGIDMDAKYGDYDITYGEAIEYMAYALKMTLFGTT